jgi:hypothetical protein
MTNRATGPFEVKLTPQSPDEGGEPSLARFSLDKQFHGELEATSRGQMLAASTATSGSAGYVAIEKVTGTLHGRAGSFLLQHNGIMERGAGRLAIAVIPDSGTGELAGLSGTMNIVIAPDGQHTYELDYTLGTA